MNKDKLNRIPQKPGVYIFKDNQNAILYIGKSRNLKNRVNSYFQKSAKLEPGKQIMVGKTANMEYIMVDSDVEALLLESSLIKKHRPPYNISLKDQEEFVYVKITLPEDFPSVLTVRKVLPDKCRYFGPYTSSGAVKSTLRLVRKIFPYKICKNPPEKPCLAFYLGRCSGHLTETTSQKDYRRIIEGVIKFLEGKNKYLQSDLKKQMQQAARLKQFEKAARFRDQIRAIERIMEKQKVISAKKENQDIISIARNDLNAAVNLFMIREGKLLNREQFLLRNTAGSAYAEILESFLSQYYPAAAEYPKEIILPYHLKNLVALEKITRAKFLFPSRGKKKKLIRMGEENAMEFLRQRMVSDEAREKNAIAAVGELANSLGINKKLRRLEAYDISNIQGTSAVGSMVVFTDGVPDKSQYRKFTIKTVRGINDPAMMAEVIGRRFRKLPGKEKTRWPLPDLIILDGGKGQLSAAGRALALTGLNKPYIALAKREEEIFFPGKKESLRLDQNTSSLQLLRRIRDEAHRFAIGFYRKTHEKEIKKSVLDEISGIGPITKKKLLRTFGSAQGIKNANLAALEKTVGKSTAKRIKDYF